MNAARLALAQGDLQRAMQAAQALAMTPGDEGEGLFLLGVIASETGQAAQAVPLIEQALVHAPDNAEYLAQYARLLILLRRDGEAATAARAAAVAPGGDARTMDTVGCVLARLGDHEGSIAPFGEAVVREPENLSYRYNLAAACGFTGRVEEAREHYEEILEADPGDARTHYALSILSRQTREDNHVERLEAVIAHGAAGEDLVRMRYALAKELEDIGEPARAFAALSAANAAHKRATRYDFAQDAATFDAIEAAFTPPIAEAYGLADGGAPIFVVGMPRTGTTLVDRILSSHPDVGSAGELQAMPLAIKQAARTPSRKVLDAETAAAAMTADPAEIGRLYHVRAAHHLPRGVARFVDKLPANFLNIGHIARALPDARIVCLRRGAMDTVWSNFRNLFALSSPYYGYSYDLMDTARYYARFDRLMAHWEWLYPGRVLSLGYEALVTDQQGETRRLLAHCGLDWDPACLAFHENTAAVATPSAAQVRRAINAEGIGRWRTHEAGMADVRRFFAAEGIATD